MPRLGRSGGGSRGGGTKGRPECGPKRTPQSIVPDLFLTSAFSGAIAFVRREPSRLVLRRGAGLCALPMRPVRGRFSPSVKIPGAGALVWREGVFARPVAAPFAPGPMAGGADWRRSGAGRGDGSGRARRAGSRG